VKINNETGSITLFSASMLMIVLLCGLLMISEKTRLIRLTQERARLYLCAHAFVKAQEEYVKVMGYTNRSIYTLSKMRLVPKLSIIATNLHRAATVGQQAYHVSYLNKLTKLPHCPREIKAYLVLQSPYQTGYGVALKRDFEGVALSKPKPFKIYLPSSSNLSRLFFLEFTITLNHPLSTQINVVGQEFGWQDLSNWKQLFGSVFSLLPS
jgi:hypothetical protein